MKKRQDIWNNTFDFIGEYESKTLGIYFSILYGLLCSGNDNTKFDKFVSSSSGIWNEQVVKYYKIGCTIGTHVGPGAVGISFFEK